MQNKNVILLTLILIALVIFVINSHNNRTIIIHDKYDKPIQHGVMTQFALYPLDSCFDSSTKRCCKYKFYKNGFIDIKDIKKYRVYCFDGNIYDSSNDRDCFIGDKLKDKNFIKLHQSNIDLIDDLKDFEEPLLYHICTKGEGD